MKKELKDMTNEELWQLFPIIISEYKEYWPENYAAEKEILVSLIGADDLVRINHIGSTAVKGLYAKPTIDVLSEINTGTNIEELIKTFEAAGYICLLRSENPPPGLMFLKGYTSNGFKDQVYHIHVRYPGDWDEIYFRDYLTEHPETAKEYGLLKLKLRDQFEHDRDEYTSAKTEFIRKVTKTAKTEFKNLK